MTNLTQNTIGFSVRNSLTNSLKSMSRALLVSSSMAIMAAAIATPAHAAPQGGEVKLGEATISTTATTTTINQTSVASVIDWQSFNVAAGETVQFNVPRSNFATLNYVTGAGASTISGTVQSNGVLFLVNPNGIVFDVGSRVSAAGFTAIAYDLGANHANGFMAYRDRTYSKPPSSNGAKPTAGAAVNIKGTITIYDGNPSTMDDYTEPKLNVFGPSIEMSGTLNLVMGEVNLVSRDALVVSGTITNNGGKTNLSAGGDISFSGTINAKRVPNHFNRKYFSWEGYFSNVNIRGKNVTLTETASINTGMGTYEYSVYNRNYIPFERTNVVEITASNSTLNIMAGAKVLSQTIRLTANNIIIAGTVDTSNTFKFYRDDKPSKHLGNLSLNFTQQNLTVDNQGNMILVSAFAPNGASSGTLWGNFDQLAANNHLSLSANSITLSTDINQINNLSLSAVKDLSVRSIKPINHGLKLYLSGAKLNLGGSFGASQAMYFELEVVTGGVLVFDSVKLIPYFSTKLTLSAGEIKIGPAIDMPGTILTLRSKVFNWNYAVDVQQLTIESDTLSINKSIIAGEISIKTKQLWLNVPITTGSLVIVADQVMVNLPLTTVHGIEIRAPRIDINAPLRGGEIKLINGNAVSGVINVNAPIYASSVEIGSSHTVNINALIVTTKSEYFQSEVLLYAINNLNINAPIYSPRFTIAGVNIVNINAPINGLLSTDYDNYMRPNNNSVSLRTINTLNVNVSLNFQNLSRFDLNEVRIFNVNAALDVRNAKLYWWDNGIANFNAPVLFEGSEHYEDSWFAYFNPTRSIGFERINVNNRQVVSTINEFGIPYLSLNSMTGAARSSFFAYLGNADNFPTPSTSRPETVVVQSNEENCDVFGQSCVKEVRTTSILLFDAEGKALTGSMDRAFYKNENGDYYSSNYYFNFEHDISSGAVTAIRLDNPQLKVDLTYANDYYGNGYLSNWGDIVVKPVVPVVTPTVTIAPEAAAPVAQPTLPDLDNDAAAGETVTPDTVNPMFSTINYAQ